MSFGVIASSYTTGGGGGGGSQFASEILADSPLLYWRLGESSGSTAVDASGNGRDGTFGGAPIFGINSLTRGDADTATYFAEGTGDYATLASASWMNVSSLTITCAAVFAANGLRMFASRYHDPDGNRSWFLYSQNREFKFYARDAGGGETVASSGFVGTPGEVYFIAGYSSATETGVRVYDKTGLVGSATGTGRAVQASDRSFMVARSDDGIAYQHEAYTDEIAFFGSVLSPSRLDALATEFFAPRPWTNRTVGIEARNGTTDHTINFAPATNGSLLVAVVSGPVIHTAVSPGWTKQLVASNTAEIAVFIKTASAGESSFQVSHNLADFPIHYNVYEFPPGCSYRSGTFHNTGSWQTLTGLPGTPTVTVFYAGTTMVTSTSPPAPVTDWYFPALEDYQSIEPSNGTTQGAFTVVAYKDNYIDTTAPSPSITTNTSIEQVVTFAIDMV